MDTMTTMTKWQDEYFTIVKRIEEPVLRVAGEVAERVARFVPERPTFMTSMPTMTAVVDNQLKFRRRMVDEQAMFVHKMLKVMKPVVVRIDADHPHTMTAKPAHTMTAKPAPKRTVRKAAPRKVEQAA